MYKTPAPPPTRRLDPSSRSATPCGAAGCPRVCWRPGRQTHSVHQVELPVWEEIKAIFSAVKVGPLSPIQWIYILKGIHDIHPQGFDQRLRKLYIH